MKWFKFILSHSIFIAFCALALCYQTYTILKIKPDPWYYGFVFFATLSSYNFYWSLSRYSFNRSLSLNEYIRLNISHLSIFLFSGLCMLGFLFFLFPYYLYICGAILLTLMYSLPLWPFQFVKFTQKAGFLKPVLLAATWAFITVIVPASVHPELSSVPVLVLLTARFLFMLLLCVIFDMRDIRIDKLHALHTLATDVSRRSLQLIIYLVFALYIICGLFVRAYFNEPAQLYAFALTGIAVWIVYKLSLKTRGYFFYYFLVDGMMIISAMATFIAAF